ncbi:MAG: mechanosensitive ion channel [Thiolinea sp.]
MENYIASILLSLRNPFQVNDFVSIDGHDGNVLRLTSRATILISPDGNHIRIPNATVFKAVITNFTRHPERRFQ